MSREFFTAFISGKSFVSHPSANQPYISVSDHRASLFLPLLLPQSAQTHPHPPSANLDGLPLEGLTDPGAAGCDDLLINVLLGASGPFRHAERMVALGNDMHRHWHDQLLQRLA